MIPGLEQCAAPQGDAFARKATVSGLKATLLEAKATVLAHFARDRVTRVNTPTPKLNDSAVKPEWV